MTTYIDISYINSSVNEMYHDLNYNHSENSRMTIYIKLKWLTKTQVTHSSLNKKIAFKPFEYKKFFYQAVWDRGHFSQMEDDLWSLWSLLRSSIKSKRTKNKF